MRLAKFLAHGGIASRRSAEDLIRAGRVRVGGELVTDPARDVVATDRVEVDGAPVIPEETEVWILNKPVGVVSTARDPGGRTTVVDLVESERRLYPVGRLDTDSSGLILLANDGELANRITHPRYEVPKTYRVTLKRGLGPEQIRRLAKGVDLDDGPTAPAEVTSVDRGRIEIVLKEGRNRQVRRMVEAVGDEAVELERVAIASLRLGRLRPGRSRRLGKDEIARLWKDAGGESRER